MIVGLAEKKMNSSTMVSFKWWRGNFKISKGFLKMVRKIRVKNSCPSCFVMAKSSRTRVPQGTSNAGVAQW